MGGRETVETVYHVTPSDRGPVVKEGWETGVTVTTNSSVGPRYDSVYLTDIDWCVTQGPTRYYLTSVSHLGSGDWFLYTGPTLGQVGPDLGCVV